MEFLLRTHNVTVTAEEKQRISRSLDFNLDRFLSRVRKIRVRLVDLNGPKRGRDKLCELAISIRGMRQVAVTQTSSSVTASVSKAARIAKSKIARQLARKLLRSGDPATIRHSSFAIDG